MSKYFHEQMVRNVSAELSEEEKQILTQGIVKLNRFFKQRGADMEMKKS